MTARDDDSASAMQPLLADKPLIAAESVLPLLARALAAMLLRANSARRRG
jgi:hypothetical protein